MDQLPVPEPEPVVITPELVIEEEICSICLDKKAVKPLGCCHTLCWTCYNK